MVMRLNPGYLLKSFLLYKFLTPQPHRLVCMLGYLANFSNLVSCLHWIRAILLCRDDVSNLEHAPLWRLIPEKTMKYVMYIFCCRIWRTAKKWEGFRNLVSTIVGILIVCSSCQLNNSSKRIGHVILTLISRLFLDLLKYSICARNFFRQLSVFSVKSNWLKFYQFVSETLSWRNTKLHKMGCCLSKNEETQDNCNPNEEFRENLNEDIVELGADDNDSGKYSFII